MSSQDGYANPHQIKEVRAKGEPAHANIPRGVGSWPVIIPAKSSFMKVKCLHLNSTTGYLTLSMTTPFSKLAAFGKANGLHLFSQPK
jgi:hypothetical protein